MGRRSVENRNIRKLTKTTRGSAFVRIPIEMVRNLKWRDKQNLVVRQSGKKIIIEDWKK